MHDVEWQIYLLDWKGFRCIGINHNIMILKDLLPSIIVTRKPNGLWVHE